MTNEKFQKLYQNRSDFGVCQFILDELDEDKYKAFSLKFSPTPRSCSWEEERNVDCPDWLCEIICQSVKKRMDELDKEFKEL